MKAAVLKKLKEPIVLEDVATPTVGPYDVLVKTKACGICGTDVHMWEGWGYTPDLPFVMGHEPSGIVAEIGDKVTHFAKGDRVVTNNFFTCGSCLYCRTNRETQCENLDGILGVLKHWGGYGEFFVIPERQLFHLPDKISFPEGAVIADAVVTAAHAVERGRVSAGEVVAVVGVGGCGSAAVQISKFYGASVLGLDITDAKVAHIQNMAGIHAINVKKSDPKEFVFDHSEGKGATCVIDTVGSEESIQMGMSVLRRGSRLVILGYTQQRYPLDPRQMAVNEMEIIGTRSGGRQCTANAIHFVADDRWKPIVTDHFRIEDVNDALKMMKAGEALGRIVLTFDD
ncbi:MAG: alcohol dehydrogenase catalytic domain-containing protein [Chloroflexi bacterium]|nr:alcohol dehydrogenase catalytic domain-containing protein [Chloroflexota bacterium]